jgi:hypothetical protein
VTFTAFRSRTVVVRRIADLNPRQMEQPTLI